MAARNPTAFTTNWPDEDALQPGKPVLASTLDSIFDDQQFIRDQSSLVWSEVWPKAGSTSSTPATVKRIYTRIKDKMETASSGNITCECSVLVWASDATTDADVTVTDATSGDSVTFNVVNPGTTPTWQALAEVDLATNTQECDLTVDLSRPVGGGSGTAYVGGIIIITKEL